MDYYEILDEQEYLAHYGMPRRSGRYPWGSGDNPYQHEGWFNDYVNDMKASGMSEADIAESMGMSTTILRQRVSYEKDLKRRQSVDQARDLKDKGYSNVKIGEIMGINESSVRSLLNKASEERMNQTQMTVDILKQAVESGKYIDVGKGVDNQMGISRTKLDTAVSYLEDNGYKVSYISYEVMGTNERTTAKVLTKDDVEYKEISDHKSDITTPIKYSPDRGATYENPLKGDVQTIKSNRVRILYAEDGGSAKDGVIEIRPGIPELDLGNAHYAQVRIAADYSGTEDLAKSKNPDAPIRYLKGVAVYNANLPEGVDIIFNSSKHKKDGIDKGVKMVDTFDEESRTTDISDPSVTFGATVRQKYYNDPATGERKISALNIVREEGEWATWSKTLAAQMLSKQSPELAQQQLDITYDGVKSSFDEIKSITNPVIKSDQLKQFADECDTKAVELSAVGLPRQAYKLILPVHSLKDDEIYAPTLKDGEYVSLVRYPHGGIFEIPTLRVNNKNAEAKSFMQNAQDAVGINGHVAGILSGADFDGDTVLCIPNKDGKVIKNKPPLEGLKNFDPRESYPFVPGMKIMTEYSKGMEMGKITNLICDMTTLGAPDDELERAVKHSMVVIDAYKHKLNYTKSYSDNNIADLQKKYQGKVGGGANTIISRSTSQLHVPERESRNPYSIDPETGKKIFNYTGATRLDNKGREVPKLQKSTKMYETDDAFTLTSGTGSRMEDIYADYANKMKALANEARKEIFLCGRQEYSPSAAKAYKTEVAELKAGLNTALKSQPLERKANIVANVLFKQILDENPQMSYSERKAAKAKCLVKARMRVGAHKERIDISERQWEAIQAGAVSETTLRKIIANSDADKLKALAMPREETRISESSKARVKSMINAGYTQAEVADYMGISASSVNRIISEKNT